jgi:diaminopropionate ammonia-lyase
LYLENEFLKIKVVDIKSDKKNLPRLFSQEEALRVRNFHSTIPNYSTTPLVRLRGLAEELNVSEVLVKDESYRFGLNAFKVLGGAYAVAKIMCKKLGLGINEINFDYLRSSEAKNKIGKITFVTATDGNHGRGIAWTAKQLNQEAVIYMPKGTAERRVKAIEELGARVIVTDLNYDDAVRFAQSEGFKNGWYMVQDTAWQDYEEIPLWIMQGYMTMVLEAVEQMNGLGIKKPTHVFLQAGVGAMAGSVLGYLVNRFRGEEPIAVVIEPKEAACIFESARIGDGKPHSVGGDLKTIMAGLACGEPNTIGWEILRDWSHYAICCDDYVSARGIRILANPAGNDPKVISGESGSVGIGMLSLIMKYEELDELKKELKLDENSVILIFNTEGDTDPVNYRKILWDGLYPTPEKKEE